MPFYLQMEPLQLAVRLGVSYAGQDVLGVEPNQFGLECGRAAPRVLLFVYIKLRPTISEYLGGLAVPLDGLLQHLDCMIACSLIKHAKAHDKSGRVILK